MNSVKPNIREIFSQALDIEAADQRSTFLDRACQGDLEVRQKVEDLLVANADAGKFMNGTGMFQATITGNVAESPGDLIGPYKLLEEIGEGGMGVVYMAQQREPVRRMVALKIIKPGMDTRQVVLRFEAERQALALMGHPNIAHVLDAGSTESGRPYFVMELVRGIPITEYCDQNHLDTRQRLELFTSVCQAVQHAHQKGIIHRDIKPSNVMVTLHDGTPVPKIIDFGVAKAIDRQLTERTLFTNYAQMVGTPLYMSPEQAEMSGLDVDTRTDIYSLGVLLYELLTGNTPFERDRLRDATYDELRRIIREEEPLRPSARVSTLAAALLSTVSDRRGNDPRKLSRLFRGELDWIVMKALEKDRTRRYETPSAFAADVQRFLEDEAVEACPPSTAYKFKKMVRRNKAGFTTAAMVLGALVMGIVMTTWQAFRAENALAAEQIAHNNESKQRIAAQNAETLARDAEAAVRKLAEKTRRQLYLSDMNRAQQEWNDANIDGVLKLLDRHRPEPNQRDLRSFEWYYLGELCRRGANTPTLHLSHRPYCVRYSPDGQLIATGDRGGMVKLWDANTRRLLHEFGKHPHWVCSIAFSPDGMKLASGDRKGTVKLWDVQSRKLLRTLDKAGTEFAFSGDGEILASTWSKYVKLWDVATGEQLVSLEGHKNTVSDLVFFPDGKTLASCSFDSLVKLWDTTAHEEVATFNGLTVNGRYLGLVTKIAVAPDAKTIATGTANGAIVAWDVASQSPRRAELTAHEASVYSLAFSPDGKTLASGSSDGTAKLWNAKNQRLLDTLKGHSAGLTSVAFAPDGRTLATASGDKTVKFWDLAFQPRSQTLKEPISKNKHNRAHVANVKALAISPDGKTLASSGAENAVKLWDLATDQLRATLEGHTERIWDVTFSPDGKLLATAGKEKVVEVWNVDSGKVLATLTGHTDLITSVAFSPDGKSLASGDTKHTVILWNLATTEKQVSLKAHDGIVSSVLYSRDGKTLITAGLDGIKCWNAATGELRKTFSGHASEIYCLAISADGKSIASGSRDNTVKLWELATGELQGKLTGHTGLIYALAFAPDGKTLASGSWDRTVKIWDLQSYELRITLKPQSDLIRGIAFSPDGATLAAGTELGVVQLWRAATEDEMTSLLQRVQPKKDTMD